MDSIIKELADGIHGLARKEARGNTHIDPEDLEQEAWLAVMNVLARYGDKPRRELILLAGRACRNRMMDVVRKRRQDPVDPDTLIEFNTQPSPVEQVIAWDLEVTLRALLSPNANRLLDERMNPSIEVLEATWQDQAAKKAKVAAGGTTHHYLTTIVNDARIAQGIGVSKATVSRAATELRETASAVGMSA